MNAKATIPKTRLVKGKLYTLYGQYPTVKDAELVAKGLGKFEVVKTSDNFFALYVLAGKAK